MKTISSITALMVVTDHPGANISGTMVFQTKNETFHFILNIKMRMSMSTYFKSTMD